LRASLQKDAAAKSAEGAKTGEKPVPLAPDIIYRAMTERLLESFPVTDADLSALAQRRGEAVAVELREAGKLDAAPFRKRPSQALPRAQAVTVLGSGLPN
jgi:hypothetical protein